MKLDIISYSDLLNPCSKDLVQFIENALLHKGIIGIRHVPGFIDKSYDYLSAARKFSALPDAIKQQYAPDRDAGQTEGYELGAEWFKDQHDQWQIDDKKASYYASIPNDVREQWPKEVDLKTPYLAVGELIFNTGNLLLDAIGLNNLIGLKHEELVGYGRMLHYQKENEATNANPNWCGAHFDHGVFTGLMPAHYYHEGVEVPEPEEAGLYIAADHGDEFEKINATDQSILLFQVGEFSQLLSHDRIRATKHIVKKAKGGIERFAFAVFYSAADHVTVNSRSVLAADARYTQHQSADGSITYEQWQTASFARYRAIA